MRSVLLLNRTYEPLKIVGWKKAVRMIWTDKAIVIKEWPEVLHSVSISFNVPCVIILKEYKKTKRHVKYSGRNVLIRDKHICQYCGTKKDQLTIDHVLPKSKGGKTTWQNCVAACLLCNNKKGHRTPSQADMPLRKVPKTPVFFSFQLKKFGEAPEEWKEFFFGGIND